MPAVRVSGSTGPFGLSCWRAWWVLWW